MRCLEFDGRGRSAGVRKRTGGGKREGGRRERTRGTTALGGMRGAG